ncbi:MAG: endonuclease/exonuclease/phosphatase family protein [Verrucomicrobia bacterium]|nr:endonuclease/exonuclease/phosphatase family protein [Verrucomicrobiota bacterium]
MRRLRQIGLLILVATAAVAVRLGLFPKKTSEEAEAQALTVRVATYNINYANQRLDLVVKAIGESQADVVALQEMADKSEAYLREQLGTDYPHMTFDGWPGLYAAQGFGLISKHPITKADYMPPEHGLFGVQLVEVDMAGQPMRFVNVHLQPVHVLDTHGPFDLLKALRSAEDIHTAEIAWIHGAADGKSGCDPKMPTVILGDFNSMSWFAAPTFLRAHGYTDSFAATVDEADTHPSWNWPTRYGQLRARIDYIFHDGAFATRASGIITNDSSDHFLVVSELELGANTD